MLITNQSKIWFPLTNSKMKLHSLVMQNSWKTDRIQYARFLKMCKDSFYKLLFKCDLAVGCSSRDIISSLYMPNLNTLLYLCSIFPLHLFQRANLIFSAGVRHRMLIFNLDSLQKACIWPWRTCLMISCWWTWFLQRTSAPALLWVRLLLCSGPTDTTLHARTITITA